jgi:hypothetical protein
MNEPSGRSAVVYARKGPAWAARFLSIISTWAAIGNPERDGSPFNAAGLSL